MSYRESSPSNRESSRTLTDAWIRASGHVLNSVVEANRATLAAFGLADGRPDAESADSASDHRPESGRRLESGQRPGSVRRSGPDRRSEPGHRLGSDQGAEPDPRPEHDWSSERSVESPDELGVGDAVRFTKSLDDEDVLAFAHASGDTNPLHLSNGYAERTRFGRRIVHGTLVSGVVSAALARLPGLAIYLSQETQYLEPVEPGDTVTAVVEVTEDLGDGRYRLSTVVTDDDDDRTVLEGEAVVLVDESPDGASDSD